MDKTVQKSILKFNDLGEVSCRWQLEPCHSQNPKHCVQVLVVSLSQGSHTSSQNATTRIELEGINGDTGSKHESAIKTIRSFLYSAAKSCLEEAKVVSLALCVPRYSGFVSRADIIERRFEGCRLVDLTANFVGFNHYVESTQKQELLPLCDSSLAAFKLSDSTSRHNWQILCTVVREEFSNRLNFDLISPSPVACKRLIWVEGRGGIEVSRRIYEGAKALGISIVLVDNPGHWLQDDNGPLAHLREDFIPMNIAVDEGFTDRLIETVQNYSRKIGVDGIMTISDARLYGVAKACEVLGFPSSPSSAYILAGDKYKTRSLEPNGSNSFLINNIEELKEKTALTGQSNTSLQYPLIVKPCFGWGSECVAKVMNAEELISAAEKASARHANSPQQRSDILIEPYIDGPEVDANFALLNGEVVFYEVADDFPSLGDAEDSQAGDNFQETANLLPTALPADEVKLVRNSIAESLRRMGFRHGTFHCEGRVCNSRMKYARCKEADMSWDLVPDPDFDATQEQSFFLHEINARPAGYLESVATLLTYGVDYYGLQMLLALGDTERFSQLAMPFENGPQWNLALLLIPEEKAGRMKTADTTLDLMHRNPDLAAAIVDHNTVIKGGYRCLGPTASQLNYLAYISVVSRESRNECLRLSENVRREFQYELEDELRYR
ncbi:glutathione synthetase ATP-binding domain-like protein [Pyrenochaeta sp. DS3sAY3a]|nr:glutathione synthetase ATP-binding domain-like protein [Pyrenochaeta sp. DS3sAY3a]